jgi:sulfide:quinone oxidoreductase
LINTKRVLVIGGGIGGTEAAIALRKKGFFVNLISDREYLYIYPLSIWIPTKEAKLPDVSVPLEKVAKGHKFSFEVAKVSSIEPDEVVLDNGKIYKKGRDFDYLIIAIGQDKLKPKGVEYT